MKRLTINVDFDGVLYNLTDVVWRFGINKTPPGEEPDRWDYSHLDPTVPKGGAQVAWIHDAIAQATSYDYFPMFEDNLRTCTELIEAGHNVRIVTARSCVESTEKCLRVYGLDTIPVVFTRGAHKSAFPCDIAVDDHPNVREWAVGSRYNILEDRRYNRAERLDSYYVPANVMRGKMNELLPKMVNGWD